MEPITVLSFSFSVGFKYLTCRNIHLLLYIRYVLLLVLIIRFWLGNGFISEVLILYNVTVYRKAVATNSDWPMDMGLILMQTSYKNQLNQNIVLWVYFVISGH